MNTLSRRSFLRGAGLLFAGAAVSPLLPLARAEAGELVRASSYFTPAEDARRVRRVLTEPLMLGPRELLTNVDLVVSRDFRRLPATHAVTGHPGGVRIRNVRILFETDTWKPEWAANLWEQPAVGISSHVSGLYLPGCDDVRIDGLHVEGAPRNGIEGWDVTRLHLQRYSATRCLQGAHFGRRVTRNRSWIVDQLRVWDTWGAPGGPASRFPGRWMGGDGLVCEVDDAAFTRLDFSGEMFIGFKLCRAHGVTIDDLLTNGLMLQGAATFPAGVSDPADTMSMSDVTIRNFAIDKARGTGVGSDATNAVQISFSVKRTRFSDGLILGNGRDGHGMQITGDCEVDVRRVGFGGFNGRRGTLPAHALEIDVREPVSTINADFETANRFFNQERIVRRAA